MKPFAKMSIVVAAVVIVPMVIFGVTLYFLFPPIFGAAVSYKNQKYQAGKVTLSTDIPNLEPHRIRYASDNHFYTAFHSQPFHTRGTIQARFEKPCFPEGIVFFALPGGAPRLPTHAQVKLSTVSGHSFFVFSEKDPTQFDGLKCTLHFREYPFHEAITEVSVLLRGGSPDYFSITEILFEFPTSIQIATHQHRTKALLCSSGLALVALLLLLLGSRQIFNFIVKIRGVIGGLKNSKSTPKDGLLFQESSSKMKISHLAIAMILAVVVVGLHLKPLLDSGFIADDYPNSQLKGNLELTQSTPLQKTVEYVAAFWKAGRLYPVANFIGVMWNVNFYDRNTEKWATLILILASFISAAYLAFLLSRSALFALYCFILVSLTLKFGLFHDPTLGFHPLMQTSVLFLVNSFSLFILYLRRGNHFFVMGSTLLFAMALLNYEVSFTFITFFPLFVIWEANTLKNKWMALLPIALVWLSILSVNLYLRQHTFHIYQGTTLSFEPDRIADTLKWQILGAFPLLPIYQMRGTFFQLPSQDLFLHSFLFLTTVALLFWVFLKLAIDQIPATFFILFGGFWIFISSILISLSERYQLEIGPGGAYLPVYLAYVGTLFVFGGAIILFFKRIMVYVSPLALRLCFLALSLFISFLTMKIHQNNERVVNVWNVEWRWPREGLEKAINLGILDEVRENETVLIDRVEPNWPLSAGFFKTHARRAINAHYVNEPGLILQNLNNYHILYFGADGKTNTQVFLQTIRDNMVTETKFWSNGFSQAQRSSRAPKEPFFFITGKFLKPQKKNL